MLKKTIRFTESDYKSLVEDYPDYPFYSKGGGGEWDIYDDKTNKKVGHWSSKRNKLRINSQKLMNWLKKNSY